MVWWWLLRSVTLLLLLLMEFPDPDAQQNNHCVLCIPSVSLCSSLRNRTSHISVNNTPTRKLQHQPFSPAHVVVVVRIFMSSSFMRTTPTTSNHIHIRTKCHMPIRMVAVRTCIPKQHVHVLLSVGGPILIAGRNSSVIEECDNGTRRTIWMRSVASGFSTCEARERDEEHMNSYE